MKTENRKQRRDAHAKGLRLQRLARECLEAQGWLVEAAQNAVVWIKDKKRPLGPLRPISVHHDLFGLWDLIAVRSIYVTNPAPPDAAFFDIMGRPRQVAFVQVTVLEHVSQRRSLIIRSGFPLKEDDVILGWKGGRDRHFRVFRGPGFERWDGECLRPKPSGDERLRAAIKTEQLSNGRET